MERRSFFGMVVAAVVAPVAVVTALAKKKLPIFRNYTYNWLGMDRNEYKRVVDDLRKSYKNTKFTLRPPTERECESGMYMSKDHYDALMRLYDGNIECLATERRANAVVIDGSMG